MNIDIDGLIELAKKATPEPWELYHGFVATDLDADGAVVIAERPARSGGKQQKQVDSNMAYIAAANPAVILALCERLREAESAMKLSLKLLQDGEVDSAIDQIEEALNPEVSDE